MSRVLDEPTRTAIEVQAPAPDRVIIADTAYPGWEASLDGQRVHLDTQDCFLAIRVPGGKRHRIDLRYRPMSYRLGLFISLVALAGIAQQTVAQIHRRTAGSR